MSLIRSRPLRRSVLAAMVVAAGLTGWQTPTRAFPGANGLIAFSSNRTGVYQIYTMRPDGSHVRQLTHFSSGGAEAPNWSSDGRKIVFDTDFDGPNAIYVMSGTGQHMHKIVEPGKAFGFAVLPAWSPTGRVIAFCAGSDGPADIWTVHPDGTHLRNLTKTPDDDECAPHFSPNGKRIAFDARTRPGSDRSSVYVMHVDGTHERRVSRTSIDAWYPNWSPDGRRLVFGSHFSTFHTSIWTIGVDGSGARRLTNAPHGLDDYLPVYSPDGTAIAFASDRGHDDFGDIWVMRPDGTGLRDITRGTKFSDDFNADWGVKV
jgi:TolB protein